MAHDEGLESPRERLVQPLGYRPCEAVRLHPQELYEYLFSQPCRSDPVGLSLRWNSLTKPNNVDTPLPPPSHKRGAGQLKEI